ncbi:hypothetical protein [Paraoerskovia sediminicola]|uniref:hypothetical protein n=1 Tax=Paraoerskovia sediminicola TaxID=1138587 RepID=UPI0025725AEE|nr:hypothetical protein [Paraoerskovia sediminicola]
MSGLALAGLEAATPEGPTLPGSASSLSATTPAADVRSPATGPVTAFPLPGTTVVHPGAQVSLRWDGRDAPTAPALRSVVVTGSTSGKHELTLLEHSDGDGASLVPVEPFDEGEDVTVHAPFDVRGSDDGRWTLTVATLADRPLWATSPSRSRRRTTTSPGTSPPRTCTRPSSGRRRSTRPTDPATSSPG